MRLVLIEWLDSFGCSADWQPLEGCLTKPLRCRSVGWLLHDGDDCKIVVPHLSNAHENVSPQGCGDMTIPSAAIVAISDLETLARP
jgi:hypothetical protein